MSQAKKQDNRCLACHADVGPSPGWHLDCARTAARLVERLEDRVKELETQVAAVRARHEPFAIYDECGHYHDPGESGVVDVPDVGLVCEDGLHTICCECDTDDGEVREDSDAGEYPCRTIRDPDGKL